MSDRPKRFGIVAGNGVLPVTLARTLSTDEPFIVCIEGEAQPSLAEFDSVTLPLEKIAYALTVLKSNRVTHVVFAGGVKRRPKASALRVPMALWPEVPGAVFALTRGDDGLLGAMVKMFERHGLKIVGAHEILPDHVAPFGVISGTNPTNDFLETIGVGVRAALIMGAHDIGQAVVALGRRVIAVEGIEGTDQMLARIQSLRAEGRIIENAQPVLIKLAKPGQELRADMPVIGPATIEGCRAAGINLICVSAGSTMIMEVETTIKQAKAATVNVIGIDPNEWVKSAP